LTFTYDDQFDFYRHAYMRKQSIKNVTDLISTEPILIYLSKVENFF